MLQFQLNHYESPCKGELSMREQGFRLQKSVGVACWDWTAIPVFLFGDVNRPGIFPLTLFPETRSLRFFLKSVIADLYCTNRNDIMISFGLKVQLPFFSVNT